LPLLLTICAGFAATAAAQEAQPPYEDKVAAALTPVPGGLTADQAAERAVAKSPEIAARTAEIDVSLAQRNRTLARYVPRLEVSASVTRTNPIDFDFGAGALSVGAFNPGFLTVGPCPDGGGDNCVLDAAGEQVGAAAPQPFEIPRNNYALNGSLSIPVSDYLLALPGARRASAADIAAAESRREGEAEEAALGARVAYYEWIRTRAQLAVAEQALASARARLEDARIGLAGGTLTSTDVLQFESLEAQSQITMVDARSFEEVARINLANLMGASDVGFEIGEDIRGDLAPGGEAMTLQELVDHAVRRRAELRALSQSVRSAEEASRSAASELFPRLDAVGSVTHANPNPSFFPPEAAWNTSWSIGLTLSWGLDRFFQARAQTKELDANARLFDAQRVGVRRAVTLEVTNAWQAWRRARAAASLSRVDLAAAEAAYSQRVALYQAGEATTTELIEAESQRFNASLRSVNARIELRLARARLDRAAALEGRHIAGPPAPAAAQTPAPGGQP
jgi:outer membrane protein TolC